MRFGETWFLKMPLKIIKNLCPYKIKKDKVRLTIDYKDDLDVFEK